MPGLSQHSTDGSQPMVDTWWTVDARIYEENSQRPKPLNVAKRPESARLYRRGCEATDDPHTFSDRIQGDHEDPRKTNMPRTTILTFFCITLFHLGVQGQSPDLICEVEGRGLFEINFRDMSPFQDPREWDLDSLALRGPEGPLPILIHNAPLGSLRSGSSIIFYADTLKGNHSRVWSLHLTTSARPRRIAVLPPEPPARNAKDRAIVAASYGSNDIYAPLSGTVNNAASSWFWREVAPHTKGRPPSESRESFALELTPPPMTFDAPHLLLRVTVQARAGARQAGARVRVDGRMVLEETWSTTGPRELLIRHDGRRLSRNLFIEVENLSTSPLLVRDMHCLYAARLMGPADGEAPLYCRIRRNDLNKATPLRFRNFGRGSLRLFDPARSRMTSGANIIIPPDGNENIEILAFNQGSYLRPTTLRRRVGKSLRATSKGAQWLAISCDRFMELSRRLSRLHESTGLSTQVVSLSAVQDAFGNGERSPESLRRFIAHTKQNWETPPRYVLLVGDADHDVDWISQQQTLMTTFDPDSAAPLGPNDQSLAPSEDSPLLGRLPFRKPIDMLRWVSRLEVASRTQHNASLPRIVMSSGMKAPRSWKTEESDLTAAIDLQRIETSGDSAFACSTELAARWLRNSLGDETLLWCHDGPTDSTGILLQSQTGTLTVPAPALDSANATSLSSICFLSDSEAGRFERPKADSFGEHLIRNPRGPLAVITPAEPQRTSWNTRLTEAALSAGENSRLGDLVRELRTSTKKRLILLGDPGMKLNRPRLGLAFDAPASAAGGEPVTIQGALPEGTTKVRVFLKASASQQVFIPTTNPGDGEPDQAQLLENHRSANARVLSQARGTIHDGHFNASLPVPSGFPDGAYTIAVAARCASGLMLGTREIQIQKP